MRVQAEFNELKVLSKNYLWGQTPIIFSNKELASNFNGQSGEEYLRATTPRARFLGELVLAR